MYEAIFGAIAPQDLILVGISAIFVGVNKTGIPGIGPLPVVLMALAFQQNVPLSSGVLLLMLGMADIAAVACYRRHANWPTVLKLLPWALIGIATGSYLLRKISNEQMGPLIGVIVLGLALVNALRAKFFADNAALPRHWAFAAVIGLLAGVSTQLANAAGPIMAIYLLVMRLEKQEYMGTAAWYFLILNWIKIPIFAWEGRITFDAVRLSLTMIPCLILGAVLGVVLLRKLPQKIFESIVQWIVLASAIYLLLKPVVYPYLHSLMPTIFT